MSFRMKWFGELRTDPDGRYAEHKKEQPVKTYKLSLEELEEIRKKYKTNTNYKPSMIGITKLKRK